MCSVEFEQIEVGFFAVCSRAHKCIANRIHPRAVQFVWYGILTVRNCRRTHDRPVAGRERLIHALPHQVCRAFGARVPELQTDLRIATLVHECNDSRPCVALCFGIEAGTAGRDTPLRRDAGHLGHNQPRATECARTQMHEVHIVRKSVDRAVDVHGRDNNAVAQRELTQTEGSEHRRDRRSCRHPPDCRTLRSALGEPLLCPLDIRIIAQAEVLVTDSLATSKQAVGELLGRKGRIASNVLEPLRGVASGVLQLHDLQLPRGLVRR